MLLCGGGGGNSIGAQAAFKGQKKAINKDNQRKILRRITQTFVQRTSNIDSTLSVNYKHVFFTLNISTVHYQCKVLYRTMKQEREIILKLTFYNQENTKISSDTLA